MINVICEKGGGKNPRMSVNCENFSAAGGEISVSLRTFRENRPRSINKCEECARMYMSYTNKSTSL